MLQKLKINKKAQLSIALLDKEEIKELNYKYRGINEPTDVLAFNLSEEGGFDGEIVIAPEVAAQQGVEENLPFTLVMSKLLIHGILHLAGYDHENPAQAEVMFRQQEELLSWLQTEMRRLK